MDQSWWKNAVIYAVDVGRFFDSAGDGIGDFRGLTEKLPYIAGLGTTCLWLLPFFPSTERDNGYDVTDYMRVDPRQGTFEDFLTFVQRAGELSIRIIIDLVVEHTSDRHPWFEAARHDEKSRFRDYYTWTHHPPPPAPGRGAMFPGEEQSVWTYDQTARAYYHHRFYSFEPGLNHKNPEVAREIERIVDYWMSFGISGFRIDAAAHMLEDPLSPTGDDRAMPNPIRAIHGYAKSRKEDALILGEVDEPPEKLASYFTGGQLDMMFNFLLNNFLILGLARQSAEPLRRGLDMMPPTSDQGQWANFLRNLDEADLERLSDEERQEVFGIFAPQEEQRIFNRGIRRRLAPMLGGDVRRLKMAWSLLYSLPGAPVLVYGDEIGMGEDLSQPGRNSVRSPMQWTAGRNGGFSKAAKRDLVQPMVEAGPYSYRTVNVEVREDDPDSLLVLIRKLGMLRRARVEIGSDNGRLLDCGSDAVLAMGYTAAEETLIVLHNLTPKQQKFEVAPARSQTASFEVLLGEPGAKLSDGKVEATLGAYGFGWIVLRM